MTTLHEAPKGVEADDEPGKTAGLVLLLGSFHGIDDRTALLREVHRLLNPDGCLFMDPDQMKLAAAEEAIDASGMLAIPETEGNLMSLVPREQTT